MKNNFQILVLCLMAGLLNAQGKLTQEQLETFQGGKATPFEKIDGEFIMGFRYVDEKGKAISNYVGLMDSRLYSPQEAIQKNALWPGNKAVFIQPLAIPINNLNAHIGIVEGGFWIPTQKGSDQFRFLPNYCLADPSHPYNELLQKAREESPHKVHERQGGGVQLVFTDHINYLEEQIRPLGGPQQLSKRFPDDDGDPPPSPKIHSQIRTAIEASTEIERIRQVKRENGDIPGGILLNDVVAKIKNLKFVKSARFDFERSAFIINDTYTYETRLTPEEVAELARVAASTDRRLGVLSQTKGINLNPKGPLMRTIAAADAYLGPIAYGFDMSGKTLKDAPKGYESAYENTTKEARWWLFNWDKVMRQGDAALLGQEPRLFLEFKDFTFGVDLRGGNKLVAEQMNLKINYQAFTTDWGGDEHFSSEPIAKTEPHFAQAVEHLRANYADYEVRNIDLLKTRYIAETFALLKYLIDNQVSITNWYALENLKTIEIPYAYESYANFGANSDQARWAANALASLEWVPSIFVDEDDELRLTWLMLQYAVTAQDIKKIAYYRKEAQSLLNELSESSSYYAARQKLLIELNYKQAIGVAGKVDFANRHVKSHPSLAKNYYRAAIDYYEKVTEIEPENFFAHLQLAWILEASEETAKGNIARQKGFEVALHAAEKNNAFAQYTVGNAFLDERFGRKQQGKAEEYYRKAAEQGYPEAALQAGYLIGFAKGYSENTKQAIPFFQQAANEGLPEARFCLASCLRFGLGIDKDNEKAYDLMRLSAEANYPNAQLSLGQMLLQGTGTRSNRALARFWIKRAADQGLPEAKRELTNI